MHAVWGQWEEYVFQGKKFYLPRDSRETFRDFCRFPAGPENVKFSGVRVPLWGKFNGEVENFDPNFSPPNYSAAAVGGGLDAGARPLLNFGSLGTWAPWFGRKKIFSEKIFFRRNR